LTKGGACAEETNVGMEKVGEGVTKRSRKNFDRQKRFSTKWKTVLPAFAREGRNVWRDIEGKTEKRKNRRKAFAKRRRS